MVAEFEDSIMEAVNGRSPLFTGVTTVDSDWHYNGNIDWHWDDFFF